MRTPVGVWDAVGVHDGLGGVEVFLEAARLAGGDVGPMSLHEEGLHSMLEGGDRTGCVGEGGPEMGKGLGLGAVLCRRLGPWVVVEECGAELALCAREALPDAQQGAVAEVAVEVVAGGEDAVGQGVLEELPESGGGQAEASDFVGEPDGEGLAATGQFPALVAQDSPSADDRLPGTVLVKAVDKAVANEGADAVAMRTGGQLEPFEKGVELVVVAVKASQLVHGPSSAKIAIVAAHGRSGVAGYEKYPGSGVRGKTAVRCLSNSLCRKHLQIG